MINRLNIYILKKLAYQKQIHPLSFDHEDKQGRQKSHSNDIHRAL